VQLVAPNSNVVLTSEDLIYIKRVFRTVFTGYPLTVAYNGKFVYCPKAYTHTFDSLLGVDFVIELSYTVPGILGEAVAWLHTYQAQVISAGALVQALRLAPSGQLRGVRHVILDASSEPSPAPSPSSNSSSKTSPLAIALAAGIGGAALVLAIIALVLAVRKTGPRAGYTAVQ
jgi:hypothetical protein